MTEHEHIDLLEQRCREYLHVIRTGRISQEHAKRLGKDAKVPTALQMQEAIYHLTGVHQILSLIEAWRKVNPAPAQPQARKARGAPRVGAVKHRSQIKNPITGTWTKRDDTTGKFMDVKADPKPFKGVRKTSGR